MKGRAPRHARATEVVPVPWSAGGAALIRVAVELEAGDTAGYLVPLTISRTADAGGPALRVPGGSGQSPTLLVDATTDATFRAQLGAAFAVGVQLDGDGARLLITPTPSPTPAPSRRGAPEAPLGLDSRLVGAEQSNTSIVYGDRAILKLVRRLEPGVNPELEIAHFLASLTDFRHTPELLGEMHWERAGVEPSAAGMLSRFLPGAIDGWSFALVQLRATLTQAAKAHSSGDGDVTAAMVHLGRVTRQLHEALASHPEAPGFAVRSASTGDVATWAAATRRAADRTMVLLETRARTLERRTEKMATALSKRRSALLDRVDEMARAAEASTRLGTVARHHGDFHLGQVLRDATGDWKVIDFEGEPLRTLEQRRAPHSPVRDVAGMLRSFAYAAATAAAQAGGGVNAAAETCVARWERSARESFLWGYDDGVDAASAASPELVTLFETEKLFYELEYELNHRPDWVWIPLRGVAKLF